MGVFNCSMFCCTLLCVRSSITIILMGKRELVALLNLSSWCLVIVERLFLAVPQGCLRFVIVVFPDHTHLLFLERCILISYTNSNKEHTNRDTQFQTIPIYSIENIKIGDKTVYYKSCFENGIVFINDLTNNDGSIYTYDELKATTYNVTINFLQYSGLVRSILAWKKTLNLANIEVNPIIQFSIQIYLKSKKGAQDMYHLLNKTTEIPAGKILD